MNYVQGLIVCMNDKGSKIHLDEKELGDVPLRDGDA
jgi:hypothetical protein